MGYGRVPGGVGPAGPHRRAQCGGAAPAAPGGGQSVHLRGQGQAGRTGPGGAGRGRRDPDLRRRAHPGPGAEHRAGAGRRPEGAGPHRPDPGHLRPACPNPRGADPGGAGPVLLPASAPGGTVEAPGPPGRRPGRRRLRGGPAGTRRDPAGDRPAPHPRAYRFPEPPAGGGAPRPRRALPPPAAPRAVHRRAGRLHQRRQELPAQRPLSFTGSGKRGRRTAAGLRGRPAVRHPGPHHPAPAPALRLPGAAHRHGRLHPQAAHAAGGRLPGHPGGRRGSRPAGARGRRLPPPGPRPGRHGPAGALGVGGGGQTVAAGLEQDRCAAQGGSRPPCRASPLG